MSGLGTRYAVFKAVTWYGSHGYNEPIWKVATVESSAHGRYFIGLATFNTWQRAMDHANRCIQLDKEQA